MGCSVPLCKCPTASPWWVAGGWQHPQPPACSFTPSRWEKGQWLEISRVDFAIEMKKSSRWCFLMKPYLFPVSVGASLPAATSAPAIKAPFHPIPPKAAGCTSKTNPAPNAPSPTVCTTQREVQEMLQDQAGLWGALGADTLPLAPPMVSPIPGQGWRGPQSSPSLSGAGDRADS